MIDTRTYDLGGRLSTSTYSNGAVTTWNYRVSGSNKDNLLANITTTNPGADKVGTYTYTWDANRNKTAETNTNSPLTGFSFNTWCRKGVKAHLPERPCGCCAQMSNDPIGYHNENRVTAWNRSDSNQNQTWNLSLVGNWNTFNQTGTGPFNQTRTHGLAHEFTSFTGTSSGTLAYDVKGNLISRPATLAAPGLNLTWDFDNRLGGADVDGTPASNEVTFQYDALGSRVARTESGITTIFVQAGQQTFADYTSGAAPSSPTYRYVYGDYIDEPVMRETSSGNVKHFYHRNQQYSITALSDNSGNTAERYVYTAHGGLIIFNGTGTQISMSAISNRYTWTGREWDNSLAMYYFRARWFEPSAGRFTNRDPLGYVDGMSLFRGYFGLGEVDPLGLKKIKIVLAAFINGNDGKKLSTIFNDFETIKFRADESTSADWSLLADSTWFMSPAPQHSISMFPASALYFRTDSRDKYEGGTARARHTVTFDTDDAGDMEGKASIVFENDPTFGVFRWHGTLDGIEGRIKEKKSVFTRRGDEDDSLIGPLNGSVKDVTPGTNSQIRGSASGSDPLAFGAPSLDYDFAIDIKKCREDSVDRTSVWIFFTHDKYPDYEVLVDDVGVYHFRGDGSFLAGGLALMSSNGNKTIKLGDFD